MRTKIDCFNATLDITSPLRQNDISAFFHYELCFHLFKNLTERGRLIPLILNTNVSQNVNK